MTCGCQRVTGFGILRISPVTISYPSGGGTTTFTPIRDISDLLSYNVPGPGLDALTAFVSNTKNATIRAWLAKSLQGGTGYGLAKILLSGSPPFNTLSTTPPTNDWRVILQMIYQGTGKASAAWCNSAAVAQAWVDYQNATSINLWQSIAHVGEAVALAVGAGYALPALAGSGASAGAAPLAPTSISTGGEIAAAQPISLGTLAPVSGDLATLAPVGAAGAAGGGGILAGAGQALGTVAGVGGSVLKTAGVLQQLSALGKTPAQGAVPISGPVPSTRTAQSPSVLIGLIAAVGLGALFLLH